MGAHKRPQMGIRLEPEMRDWVLSMEVKTGCTKTRLAMAGLLAFYACTQEDREELMQWASLLDAEEIGFSQFEKSFKKKEADRKKNLQTLMNNYFRSISGGGPSRRRRTKRGEV